MTTLAMKIFVYTLTFGMTMEGIQANKPSSLLFYQRLSNSVLSGSGSLISGVTGNNPIFDIFILSSTTPSETSSSGHAESEETTKKSTEDSKESTEKTEEYSSPVTAELCKCNPYTSPKQTSYPAPQTKDPAPLVCKKSRYRTFDGSCNNLNNPSWGMSQRSYGRMTPYNYANGMCSMPRSISGEELPNARELSFLLFVDKKLMDDKWTICAQQWGQIVAHEMSHTADITQCRKEPAMCCYANGQLAPDAATNPVCAPIMIPPNDPIHASAGTQCLNFIRTGTTCSTCSYERPAEPRSTVTAYMDLSLVYGNDDKEADSLRSKVGGRMKTKYSNGQEWPPQVTNSSMICDLHSPDEPCFSTGDSRMNQSPQLAILQIVLLREHNRIADALALINPHWNDEKLFQEARRIHIAENQHINYYEYFPILVGTKKMAENKLIYLNNTGYVNDYDRRVNAAILGEYASAAFRFFHTLIVGSLRLLTEDRTLVDTLRLSDWFNRPKPLVNYFDDLTRGLATQEMGASDQYCDDEIRQFLFRGNNTYGEDLRATDIQRGRDHGLPTYAEMRRVCNLSVPKTFEDLLHYISKENVAVLKKMYYSIKDLDLVVGGSLELKEKGSLVGPTFLCIIIEQLRRSRVGDRFFFEMGHDCKIRFTLDQLQSIRKSSMARMICDNTDGILQMQPRAFDLLSQRNKLVSCDELPAIDLSLWKEKL